jgi:hypothetical protein
MSRSGPPEVPPASGSGSTERGASRIRDLWPSGGTDRAILVYALAVLVTLGLLSPRLLAAREGLGFPLVSTFEGVPVAVEGIYFFTALSFLAGVAVLRYRGTRWPASIALAILGVAAYEALYGVGYALLEGRPSLLVPSPGFPLSGWPGLATWVGLEALVASLAVVAWRRAGIDRALVLDAAVFVGALLLWKLAYGLAFPPGADSLGIFTVNTLAEVSGSLLLPLLFSARAGARTTPLPLGVPSELARPSSDR